MRVQAAKARADLTGCLRTVAPPADSVRCGGPAAPPADPGRRGVPLGDLRAIVASAAAAARALRPQAPADATAGPRRPQTPVDRSLARL